MIGRTRKILPPTDKYQEESFQLNLELSQFVIRLSLWPAVFDHFGPVLEAFEKEVHTCASTFGIIPWTTMMGR
jgi:hypothetical protein